MLRRFLRAGHWIRARDGSPRLHLRLPRSGTSLTGQVLASHSQVVGLGESISLSEASNLCPACWARRRAPWIASGVSTRDLGQAGWRPPGEGRGDRRPGFVRRRQDARQLPLSRLAGDSLPPGQIYPLPPRPPRYRRLLLVDELHASQLGQRPWEYRLALRGVSEPDASLERVLPVPVLQVDYEEIVSDFETTARAMIDWCGLDWEPACLDFTRRKESSAPPVLPRSASRSIDGPWGAGGTMRSNWDRSWGS